MNLREIADNCGVSVATVSNVLNNTGRVGQITREKVEEYLRSNNYDPMANAPAARHFKTRTIGMVLPVAETVALHFYNRGMFALYGAVKEVGYDGKVFNQADLAARFSELQLAGKSRLGCDGMIIFCPEDGWEEQARVMRSWGMPVAVIRRQADIPGIVFIENDDYKAGRSATEFLANAGHRVIAYHRLFTRPKELPFRQNGYHDVIREQGLADDPRLVTGEDAPGFDLGTHITALRQEGLHITAIQLSGDLLAPRAIRSLARAGLSVPGDISLIGFDDDPVAAALCPTLSTVHIPVEEMLAAACRHLVRPAPGYTDVQTTLKFDTHLVIRDSTRNLSGQ